MKIVIICNINFRIMSYSPLKNEYLLTVYFPHKYFEKNHPIVGFILFHTKHTLNILDIEKPFSLPLNF